MFGEDTVPVRCLWSPLVIVAVPGCFGRSVAAEKYMAHFSWALTFQLLPLAKKSCTRPGSREDGPEATIAGVFVGETDPQKGKNNSEQTEPATLTSLWNPISSSLLIVILGGPLPSDRAKDPRASLSSWKAAGDERPYPGRPWRKAASQSRKYWHNELDA